MLYHIGMLLTIFTSFTINNANSVNILCLMGTPSPSHHIWNKSIMKALADKGNYNLTILTFEMEQSTKSMHFIHIEDVYQSIYEQFVNKQKDKQRKGGGGGGGGNDGIGEIDFNNSKNVFSSIVDVYSFFNYIDTLLLESNATKQLLNYPLDFKFDLILYDATQSQ